MKIGLFGGSFNPIHKGHIKIARYAMKKLGLDKMIFIPTSISPFKQKGKSVSGQDKINMINLVLEPGMEVSDFEVKKGGVSYTFETIRYFKKLYKDDQLYFLIGSDNLPKLHKWEHIDEIVTSVNMVVFKRSKKFNKLNAKKYKLQILDNPIFEYSSTQYKKGYLNMVEDRVQTYIQSKGLYVEEIIHNSLSALRAKHSLYCADFAANLAKTINLSAKDAYLAGIMHDVAKEWSEEASRDFINAYAPEYNGIASHKLHQICGYLWAKEYYLLENEAILHAIKVHTTMDDGTENELSNLDKVLFIADKICHGRKAPGIQKIRELVFKDFQAGFKEVVKLTYDFNIQKGVVFDKRAKQIYDKYLEIEEK